MSVRLPVLLTGMLDVRTERVQRCLHPLPADWSRLGPSYRHGRTTTVPRDGESCLTVQLIVYSSIYCYLLNNISNIMHFFTLAYSAEEITFRQFTILYKILLNIFVKQNVN